MLDDIDLYCGICGLRLRQRQWGPCRFRLRSGKFCDDDKGDVGSWKHWPTNWWAGYDHVDGAKDAPCACGHPKHYGPCPDCANDPNRWLSADHEYRPRVSYREHIAEEMHMSHHCRPIVAVITDILEANPDLSSIADPSEWGNRLVGAIDDGEMRALARAEWDALPSSFIAVMHATYLTAADAGVPFSLESEEPAKPIKAARGGRVDFRIEHDEEGVRMYVAHIHRHHASWMKEPVAAGD